jgi:outer membrane lipoprotein-sorting protein
MCVLHCAHYRGGQRTTPVWTLLPSPCLFALWLFVAVMVLAWLGCTGHAMGDSVDPHAILRRMANAYSGIYDYTALFLRRERINGKLLPLEKIELRFQEPFKVYMSWLEPYEGRTIAFVKGENDNKLLVNPGGLLTFLRLALEPTSDMATRDEHHSVLQAGLRNTIDRIMREYQRGMEHQQVSVELLDPAEVDGRPAYHLAFTYPADKSAGYYAYRGELWIDKAYYLPTRVQIYDWDNQLYEHYEYRQLQLNPGLDDADFRLPSAEQAERPKNEDQQWEATP